MSGECDFCGEHTTDCACAALGRRGGKSSQEIIEEINFILAADLNDLTDAQKIERGALIEREKRMSRCKYEPSKDSPYSLVLQRTVRYADYYGKEISLSTWSLAKEYGDSQICDDFINGFRISTIWMGLNHSFWPGSLQIFETMIFSNNEDGRPAFDYQERYATLEEAKEGHKVACQFVKDQTSGH